MRWNLLQQIETIRKGQYACVRAQAPDAPVSRELLLTEMMAQTSGLILGALHDFRIDLVFAKIDSAVFYRAIHSGTPVCIESRADELREEGGWFQAQASDSEGVFAEARLLLANAGRLNPHASGQSVTFHPHFMDHYQVRDKVSEAVV